MVSSRPVLTGSKHDNAHNRAIMRNILAKYSTKPKTDATATDATPSAAAVAVAVGEENHNNNHNGTDHDGAADATRYWEDEDWVPRTSNGKERTPNMIRNELQRYMHKENIKGAPMANNILHVTPRVFYSFMDPAKFQKDPWRAANNDTYWAAARFLEALRNEPKKKKPAAASKKRSSSSNSSGEINVGASKKSKTEQKSEAITLMSTVGRINLDYDDGCDVNRVYDSCPELVKKIRAFLDRDGVTKADFLRTALGGINSNSLNRFLAGKKQDQCGNVAYERAYTFFEKLRLHQGTPKSKQRHANEAAGGFATVKERAGWFIVPVMR